MKEPQSVTNRTLPIGTILEQHYTISSVLGEGGFGITYKAVELHTNKPVAIKECFPSQLSTRTFAEQSWQITAKDGQHEALAHYQEQFLREASIMREFQDVPCIASVLDIIKEHGTVYMVMDYIDGITLQQYVLDNGAISFAELFPLMKPIMQALMKLHQQGIIHRDISPDNLMVGIDNQLHLIDFGAFAYENAHDQQTLPIMIKSGYTPLEQYREDGSIGAWSDIYSLSATMYLALTRMAPTDAMKRKQGSPLPSLAAHATITSWQAAAIERGLSIDAADRFQNMESFYQALLLPPLERDKERAAHQAHLFKSNPTVIKASYENAKNAKKTPILLALTAFVVLACVIWLTLMVPSNRTKPTTAPASTTQNIAGGATGYYGASKDNSGSQTNANQKQVLVQEKQLHPVRRRGLPGDARSRRLRTDYAEINSVAHLQNAYPIKKKDLRPCHQTT